MYNKCNTDMNKYTVIQTIRFSEKQAESLKKLKDYDVNVSQFISRSVKHIHFETIVKNNTYGEVW